MRRLGGGALLLVAGLVVAGPAPARAQGPADAGVGPLGRLNPGNPRNALTSPQGALNPANPFNERTSPAGRLNPANPFNDLNSPRGRLNPGNPFADGAPPGVRQTLPGARPVRRLPDGLR